MSQALLEMAKELVTEQIRMKRVQSEDVQPLLRATYETLLSLQQNEMSGSAAANSGMPDADPSAIWKRSIAKYAITCLECGGTFKQLSRRHLRIHDLDSKSYRAKYGIPRTQPLSARVATARRRELAKQIRPWEQAASMREAGKTTPKKRGRNA
ncbi:MAG: hypothetical protein ETSY2_44670 [Candidatus Entotheonella gemina]|uniref:MucR family transcriptional regulator n=1 Tax=Candidatus Entotheonella gemina TaxID=1429439 RepID=W4LI95_9BACT|nr:MAG: hypothetical protein ETSY2_44670 [Candidatus Entotheonella gemina]